MIRWIPAAAIVAIVLGVPAVEPPPAGGVHAVVRGVPVLVRPIRVAGVEVDDHVVGEVLEVELCRNGLVVRVDRQVLAGAGEQVAAEHRSRAGQVAVRSV